MEKQGIIDAIIDLKEDPSTPKNVKLKMEDIQNMISANSDNDSMVLTKAIHAIEELTEDVNMQQHIRTQLMSLLAVLEMNL